MAYHKRNDNTKLDLGNDEEREHEEKHDQLSKLEVEEGTEKNHSRRGLLPWLKRKVYPNVDEENEDISLKVVTHRERSHSEASTSAELHSSEMFPLARERLMDLMEERQIRHVKELGGLEGIVNVLHTDIQTGLRVSDKKQRLFVASEQEDLMEGLLNHQPPLEHRKDIYGSNILTHVRSKSFLMLVLSAWNDKTLILLSIASLISLSLGIYEDVRSGTRTKWIEGLAIFIAVLVVVTVTAFNDYQKEKNFRKLNAQKEDRNIKVIRNGRQDQISIFEICVGDVVILASGDILCADGLLIDGKNLQFDESGMTGESHAIKKEVDRDIFLLSGTKILEGQGTMLVVAVGPYSLYGKTMMGLRVPNQPTPLQKKLNVLAERIAIIGLTVAIMLLVILLVKYLVHSAKHGWSSTPEIVSDITHLCIEAITIIVVAIPEGLPMAVTLALAYSSIQMLKDQNLVRILASCETIGNATTICSDKTGTLTQNKMTVVTGYLSDISFESLDRLDDFSESLEPHVKNLICEGISVNSTAYESYDEKGERVFVGSKTETALLDFVQKLGGSYQRIRECCHVHDVIPFSSERKRMTTIIDLPNGSKRLYCKGASEIVLKQCSKCLSVNGDLYALNEQKYGIFNEIILSYASDALRTICLAYKDIDPKDIEEVSLLSTSWIQSVENHLTCLGIVGVQDPLRPEVSEAIRQCQSAGIMVRMVTGDSKLVVSEKPEGLEVIIAT
jgi:Ca2+-transporting ATPase